MTEYNVTIRFSVPWGYFGSDGRWYPNATLGSMPVERQLAENIEEGHVCAGCLHRPSKCVCASSSNHR